MARGTPITALRLDPEIKKTLAKICEDNGISLSDGVRLAILDFIAKHSGESGEK